MNSGVLQSKARAAAKPSSALSASLIATHQGFLSLQDEWNVLAAESEGATVFQRHEWNSAWWETQSERSRLFVIVVRQGSELAAIAPLCIVERQQALLRFRHLQFLGAPAADYADFLVRGDRQPCIGAMLDEVFHHQHLWDVFELNHLRTDSANALALREELGGRSAVCSEARRVVSPYLPLPPDPEMVFSRLPKSARYDLRKGLQKLSERGVVSYEVLRDRRAAMEVLPAFLETLRERELDAGRAATRAARTWLRRYFTQLLNGPARSLVHFSRLSVNDRAVAYHFGFQYGNRLYWYKPTFSPEYSECSPGKLLIQFAIESAVREGVTELDFLLGDEPYKLQWTESVREVTDLMVFSSNWRSYAARRWYLGAKPALKASRRFAAVWQWVRGIGERT
ncbi:MAG: GNAT family N-acetyltransferase [Bryobacteraceae bacterium]|jgi:CelD/BcsL family acetyltransferase involved in cellulose biosynthesis